MGNIVTYHELKIRIRALIDENGIEDFLLALTTELDETHKVVADGIDKVRYDTGFVRT